MTISVEDIVKKQLFPFFLLLLCKYTLFLYQTDCKITVNSNHAINWYYFVISIFPKEMISVCGWMGGCLRNMKKIGRERNRERNKPHSFFLTFTHEYVKNKIPYSSKHMNIGFLVIKKYHYIYILQHSVKD